jgi:hypothetical protein
VASTNQTLLFSERSLSIALQAALSELGSGRIRIPEIRKFQLAETSKAHEYLEQRHNLGSVILVP